MKIKSIIKISGFAFMLGSLSSCGSREETVGCFPTTAINVQTNINFANYYTDLLTNGWTYIDEQGAGTRGIILVQRGNRFIAFDRNAPHICPDTNTTLKVEGKNRIVCPQDGATWVIDGTPSSGVSIAPKTYPVSYNPATGVITIYN